MRNSIFILGLLMLIFSCGKEIATAIASSPSNLSTAPWRMTRVDLPYQSDIVIKDGLCVSEFGTDYVTGTYAEYMGYAQSTSVALVSDLNHPFGAGASSSGDGSPPVYTPLTASVFCIHK